MDKFVYDPAAIGEPHDDFGDVLKRARDLASKQGPIELSLHGVRIAVEEDTNLVRGCIRFADGMMFQNHTPLDQAFFKKTPYLEAEPGILEEHVGHAAEIDLSALSLALKLGKLLQPQAAQNVPLSQCWQPCFMKAGGALFPEEDMLTPVREIVRETWQHGSYLDMTIKRALNERIIPPPGFH